MLRILFITLDKKGTATSYEDFMAAYSQGYVSTHGSDISWQRGMNNVQPLTSLIIRNEKLKLTILY